MRIVSGIHRSRRLLTPKNNAVRPTSDKVRQAVFNMLHSRDAVHDAIVIDAFCGTGALGLEALSQGAAHCIFFDKNLESINITRQNIASLSEEERASVFVQDSTKLKERPETISPANLIFLDPPYQKNYVPKALDQLIQKKWIDENAFFVIELSKNEMFQSTLIKISSEKIYGDTKIILGAL